MSQVIKVGMADLNVCKAPDALTTLGLGSCVGICLYDSATKIAGMAHVMLPDSSQIRNNDNIAKFADTGIKETLDRVLKLGANKSRLVAKIAGGAQMFAFGSNNDMLRVGDRNVAATKDMLKKLGIPLVAEDTGLNFGRTIVFYPENGSLVITAVGKPSKTI